MLLLRRITGIAFSVGLGLIFLYSAYTKLLPVIETFEFTFVDLGIANWYVAPVLARLLIGLELFTGLLLILCFRLRKFTLPLATGILIFFTIYLLIQLATTGNSGNCGCFGEHLQMTPLQGILKNVVMIAAAAIAFLATPGWDFARRHLLTGLLAAVSAAMPFVINPVEYGYTSNNLDEAVNYRLGIGALYEAADTSEIETPSVDLRRGKHVVAFLSLSCPHCRVAAKKMRIIKKNNPALPVYFVLNGTEDRYRDFLDDTHASNVPSSFCLGKTFVQLAGLHLPRIYYLDNDTVVKKVDYFELDQHHIEQWVLEDGNAGAP